MGHPFCSRSRLVTTSYTKSDDENDTSQVNYISILFVNIYVELCPRHQCFFCFWIVCGNLLSSFPQRLPSPVYI